MSPRVLLASAFQLDRRGREREAIPRYKEAIALGLSDALLREALICLSSSLETVGKAKEAIRYLRRAKNMWPNDAVIDLFLASALRSQGNIEGSLSVLAAALLCRTRGRRVESYLPVIRRKLRIRHLKDKRKE